MCKFISWIETKEGNLFLTKHDLQTKKGRELKTYLDYPSYEYYDNIGGHRAIRYFFDLAINKGRNKECSNFSSPKNFPNDIIEAIKRGDFEGIVIALKLLNKKGINKYLKIKLPAREKYNKIDNPAWEEYLKIHQPAREEYNKIENPAREKYNKIEQSAREKYYRIEQSAFWEIFKSKKYRNKNWK